MQQEQPITDVQELGNAVVSWHIQTLRTIEHVLNMPEDAGIDIPTGNILEDGTSEVIDGNADHRAGFLAGVKYSLELLDTFPIKGVPVDEQPE